MIPSMKRRKRPRLLRSFLGGHLRRLHLFTEWHVPGCDRRKCKVINPHLTLSNDDRRAIAANLTVQSTLAETPNLEPTRTSPSSNAPHPIGHIMRAATHSPTQPSLLNILETNPPTLSFAADMLAVDDSDDDDDNINGQLNNEYMDSSTISSSSLAPSPKLA